MPTAYVSFCKPINFDTATKLMESCRSVLWDWREEGEGENKKRIRNEWDTIRLMISSGGGNLIAAFGAYNELKGMPIEKHTINTGATDSSAIMLFMIGKKRYATPKSAFLFHQMTWTFPAKEDIPLSVAADAARWLKTYQDMMAETIAEGSNLSRDRILEMMLSGTTLSATEAKECGLIHDIVEAAIPSDARWWQI